MINQGLEVAGRSRRAVISLRDSCGLKYLDYTNSMLTTQVSLSVCPSVLPPARWAYWRLKLTGFRSDALPRPVGKNCLN